MRKFLGTLLGVLIFLGKFFEKKAYILCVHIEGRIEGVGKEGVKVKGVKIEAYKYKYEYKYE